MILLLVKGGGLSEKLGTWIAIGIVVLLLLTVAVGERR
jgi:hypothetical protein